MKNASVKTFLMRINNINRATIVPSLVLTYIVMVVVFTSINPLFIGVNNLLFILINLAIPGIVALGNSFVLISRNIDISVGSIIGVTAIAVAKLYNLGGVLVPIPVVILVALAIGGLIGTLNGYLSSILGINSVIVTLGTLAIFRGLAYIYSGTPLLIDHQPFNFIGRGYLFNQIPLTFIYMIVLFILMQIVLRYTRFGRQLYAVGANGYVAQLYGIKVRKLRFVPFVISGITASISGLLIASQLSFGVGDIGLGFEFKVLTIVVLGGISIMGGRGSLIGVLVAIFIYGSISNGLTVVGVPVPWRETFLGLILISAILIDAIKYERSIVGT
jgi:ribose transport system permease protein